MTDEGRRYETLLRAGNRTAACFPYDLIFLIIYYLRRFLCNFLRLSIEAVFLNGSRSTDGFRIYL